MKTRILPGTAFYILAVLTCCFPGITFCGEKHVPPIRVAVLDLTSPASAPWLGAAVAESVSVKLAGVEGVTLLEREKIQQVMLANQGKEMTPELLGAEYLLTGTVQLVGKWPDEKAKIRLSAKVVSAKTAKIKTDAAFIVDGTVGKLFALESELSEKLAKALGKKPTVLQIEYHEEENLLAKQLFGEGLSKLKEAEALLARQVEKSLRARPFGKMRQVKNRARAPVSRQSERMPHAKRILQTENSRQATRMVRGKRQPFFCGKRQRSFARHSGRMPAASTPGRIITRHVRAS